MRSPIVVLGASGIVGRGAVEAALAAAFPVIAVDADAVGLDRLRGLQSEARVITVQGAADSDAAGQALADVLRRFDRPIAGVIDATPGRAMRGRLLDQPTAMLCEQLEAGLLPQLAAARHLIPLMAQAHRGGTYVLIGGPGSTLPWSGYGHQSVAAAGLRMLAQVLHQESRASDVRVQLLSIDLPVCAGDKRRAGDGPQWPTARSIGERAVALIDRSTANASPVVSFRNDAATADATTAVTAKQLVADTLQRLRHADAGASHDPDSRGPAAPTPCPQRPHTTRSAQPFPSHHNEVSPP